MARVAKHDGEPPMAAAMTGACMTAPDRIPLKRRQDLEELVGTCCAPATAFQIGPVVAL